MTTTDGEVRTPDSLPATPVTVRELISLWGVRVRDFDTVARIRHDLTEHGLTTEPPFEDQGLRDRVCVVSLSPDPMSDEAIAFSPAVDPATDQLEAEDRPHHRALRVDAIPSATQPVPFVTPDTDLVTAQTILSHDGLEQLAILDGSTLHGAITWKSLARRSIMGLEPILRNAREECQTVYAHEDLLTRLPLIRDHGYVYVRDHTDQHICGMVTVADIARQYDTLVGPFLAVGEIERRLRRFFTRCFKVEHLKQVNKKATSIDDFMFGQYKLLLDNDARWALLNWGIDRTVFLADLETVRKARNKVMHFRPDQLTPEDVDHLQRFAAWLRALDPQP